MGNVRTGEDYTVAESARPGVLHEKRLEENVIVDRATIRVDTVVHADLSIGDDFATSHAAAVSLR